MFRQALFITLAIVSSMQATTIDEIFNLAISNNKDLKSLQKSIDIANEQITISKNWQNPVVTLGRNDIRMDEPNKRDLEAMQADYIGFSQVIPMGNKLDIKQNIAKKQSSIASLNVDDVKLQLKSKVYEYAYSIKVLEQKYQLLSKYEQNIQSLEELSKALYENGKMNQTDLIKVKISYSKLQLQKENLQNLINNLYLKLQEITYSKVENIDVTLHIEPLQLRQDIHTHPKIQLTQELSEKYREQSRYELAAKNSDIKLNVAYFNRDSKFEDYANISVNIPLSVYGTENVKAVQAKLKSQQVSNKLDDLKQRFIMQVKTYQNNLDNALKTHQIIEQTILPLKEELQKNLESYNSFDQIKPQMTIVNLNEVISYEMMLLDEVKKYFTTYAKSIYYTQGK